MDSQQLCAHLAQVGVFAHLGPAQLSEIASWGRLESLPAGRLLFNEGDDGDSIYVMLEGAVEVFKLDANGEEVLLNTRGVGSYFGELALVGAGHRTASVRTIMPCSLFVLDREHVLGFLMTSRDALSGMLSGLVELVLNGSERVVEATVKQRQVATEMELQRHRAISQMVAGVAHELNTPLGLVKSAADLVSETLTPALVEALGRLQPDTRAALSDLLDATRLIGRNIDRADRLIESFKRLSVRQITQAPERIDDITEVFQEIVALLVIQHRASGLRVRLESTLSRQERSWYGVPGLLSQVMDNLVANVVRYAYPSGGGEVLVLLSARPEHYVVKVRDEGVGIPSSVLDRIFEPFFTTGRERGGSGLGLAIVRNTVTEGLGGTIEVESTVGEGTTVTFSVARP